MPPNIAEQFRGDIPLSDLFGRSDQLIVSLKVCYQQSDGLNFIPSLFPTIFDLAGIPPVGNVFRSRDVVPVRGTSWLPFLKEQRPQIRAEDQVTGWELFGRIPPEYGTLRVE